MPAKPAADLVPVVLYLRVSDDEQTLSVGQQRKACRDYCERQGYRVLREYIDEGKSGSKNIQKRRAFWEMIQASAGGSFAWVVTWNTARFGRMDSQKASGPKLTLRQNGVGLDTVSDGRLDWSTSMGRVVDAMKSEADHTYSLDRSRESVRGRNDRLEMGIYVHGKVPYGYDRLYEGDGHTIRVGRLDNFRKAKTWTHRLVINEPESLIVKRIFNDFVNRAENYRQIAISLNEDGIKGPNGSSGWTHTAVRDLLQRVQYIGVCRAGYARKSPGEAHNRIAKHEKAGVVPVIIDPRTFEAAQRIIADPKKHASKLRTKHTRALTGVLHCGHCGGLLKGMARKGAAYYLCPAQTKTSLGKCSQWRIHERDILPTLCREVVRLVDGDTLKRLEAGPGEPPDVQAMEAAADQLRAKVKRAAARVLTADDDLVPDLEAALAEMKADLAEAEGRLSLARQAAGTPGGWDAWWHGAKHDLLRVADDGDPGHGARLLYEDSKKVVDMMRAAGMPEPTVQMPDGTRVPFLQSELVPPPGVMMERGAFRALLRRLGVEVAVYWTKNPKRASAAAPAWVVDRARLKVRFRPEAVLPVGGDTSTTTHSGHEFCREIVFRLGA